MTLELTFLGTGTSQGIPMIGCDCPVCRSDDPRDRRTRTSALVSWDDRNILIDATPELRLQCLHAEVRRVDACLITHTHADHIFGLDDLRRFNQIQGEAIPLYSLDRHRTTLEKVFGYARADRAAGNLDLPRFVFNTLEPDRVFSLFDRDIETLLLPHGDSRVLGFRFGPLAYCTDLSGMPDETVGRLQGLDHLVLGALRPKPHPKHLSLDQAVELAHRLNAKHTWFVHMGHQVSHRTVETQLPDNMHLAYDGLKLTVS